VQARLQVPKARDVVLRVVHVDVPSLGSTRLWLRMLEELPATEPDVLRIIAGDFNATLDHSPFRAVLDRGYADVADRAGQGLHATWPSDRPLGIAIDHVLVDRRIGVDAVDIVRVAGTDHRAVVADLTLPGRS
jgi:endonuclease/exonuclease/phosphatase family metal-dependent hydrolase